MFGCFNTCVWQLFQYLILVQLDFCSTIVSWDLSGTCFLVLLWHGFLDCQYKLFRMIFESVRLSPVLSMGRQSDATVVAELRHGPALLRVLRNSPRAMPLSGLPIVYVDCPVIRVVPNCGKSPLENLKPAGVQNAIKTIPASSQDRDRAP